MSKYLLVGHGCPVKGGRVSGLPFGKKHAGLVGRLSNKQSSHSSSEIRLPCIGREGQWVWILYVLRFCFGFYVFCYFFFLAVSVWLVSMEYEKFVIY